MEKILILFISLILFAAPAFSQDGGSSIEDLEKQAKAKEAELKKIKEEEQKINKEISALQKQTAQRDALIDKLGTDISYLEQNIITTENKREALERSGPMWEGTLNRDVMEHFLESNIDLPFYGSDFLEEKILFEDAIVLKAVYLSSLINEQNTAKQKISGYEEKNKELLQKTTKIEQEKSLITKDFLKRKGELAVTQKKYEEAKRELDELNKSAEQLKKLLADAEEKRKKEEEKKAKAQGTAVTPRTSIAVIDESANSLPWPVDGSVISNFGKEYRDDLKTWIFRDGIKISTKAGAPVLSVSEGTVIYAGVFRSYGNVVIVDHGKGFFTIYGFLSEIAVANGDVVGRRTPLGTVGLDTQQGSMGTGKTALYFEVRKGTTAEDPLKWLRI